MTEEELDNDCTNCPAFNICPEKPVREDYADENEYLIDLECGVWSCQKTIEKLCKENEQLNKAFDNKVNWNKQSEKDIYREASHTWDYNRYVCILKNGEFVFATSICDEAPDGSVSCWFEFCDEEIEEQYSIDDIEYWVLLEKPKGETK